MNNHLTKLIMSKNIIAIAIYYSAFAKGHVCYCTQNNDEIIWAEGAIFELCPTAYIEKSCMVDVDEVEFKKHNYKHLVDFHNGIKNYEDGI